MLLTALHADADQPDAVRVGPRSIARHELLGAASAVAEQVAGAQAVAVHADASLETVVAVVGCLLAGVPVVPVPADSGPGERAHCLADSGAQQWWGPRPEDVTLDARAVDLAARGATPDEPDPAATALILYTSGTTGPPKGVLLSRSAVAHGLDALADAWAWTPEDVLVHGLPLFHVHGLVLGVLGALRVGSPLVHTVRPTPQAYAAAGGSLYFGVPTVWSRVARDPAAARALHGARLLVSGSAALPAPVFAVLAQLTGHAPVERYGMSETLITVSTRADGERRAGLVGTPVAGVRTRLVTEDGGPVAHDGESIGELQVVGPTLFDGYLHRPEATAAAWSADGWFRTGDVATIDREGAHRIVGRASTDLIKTGGYRVGAGEVEAALLTHPDVTEAAVIGVADDDLGQRIVAYVVGNGLDPQALAQLVAGTLSVHKRPREVRVVDSLPRNAMGKVQKARLG
ncbi:acyl-CoA synthetase [Rhodococcus antarcticus]|uniref:Acyl-CoA synthetase n=1 Tax=Rhodococcus antarcticus TaxID=2987751 RepID=A0ABY6NXU4_9NOCA|nr:acyl-CoA synthetase [Rhodococcus antarcticus]UZJ24196.1 acyl-CoA synthetase [Rhodococcus antarcticus]